MSMEMMHMILSTTRKIIIPLLNKYHSHYVTNKCSDDNEYYDNNDLNNI